MIRKTINFIITLLVLFTFGVILFGFIKNEYSDVSGMIEYIFKSYSLANDYFWSFVNSNVSHHIIYRIQEFKYNILH